MATKNLKPKTKRRMKRRALQKHKNEIQLLLQLLTVAYTARSAEAARQIADELIRKFGYKFVPFGGNEGNIGPIGMSHANVPDRLVENITNSFDAVVDRELRAQGRTDCTLDQAMIALGINSGKWSAEVTRKATEEGATSKEIQQHLLNLYEKNFKDKILVVATDSQDFQFPMMSFVDAGTGVSPREALTSILAILVPGKRDSKYAMGLFNLGGPITLSVSPKGTIFAGHRAKELQEFPEDDDVWVTFVYKHEDPHERSAVYQMLMDPNGQPPTVPADMAKIPDFTKIGSRMVKAYSQAKTVEKEGAKKAHRPVDRSHYYTENVCRWKARAGDFKPFPDGCVLKIHLEANMDQAYYPAWRMSTIDRNSIETLFNALLPDPYFPYKLIELRDPRMFRDPTGSLVHARPSLRKRVHVMEGFQTRMNLKALEIKENTENPKPKKTGKSRQDTDYMQEVVWVNAECRPYSDHEITETFPICVAMVKSEEEKGYSPARLFARRGYTTVLSGPNGQACYHETPAFLCGTGGLGYLPDRLVVVAHLENFGSAALGDAFSTDRRMKKGGPGQHILAAIQNAVFNDPTLQDLNEEAREQQMAKGGGVTNKALNETAKKMLRGIGKAQIGPVQRRMTRKKSRPPIKPGIDGYPTWVKIVTDSPLRFIPGKTAHIRIQSNIDDGRRGEMNSILHCSIEAIDKLLPKTLNFNGGRAVIAVKVPKNLKPQRGELTIKMGSRRGSLDPAKKDCLVTDHRSGDEPGTNKTQETGFAAYDVNTIPITDPKILERHGMKPDDAVRIVVNDSKRYSDVFVNLTHRALMRVINQMDKTKQAGSIKKHQEQFALAMTIFACTTMKNLRKDTEDHYKNTDGEEKEDVRSAIFSLDPAHADAAAYTWMAPYIYEELKRGHLDVDSFDDEEGEGDNVVSITKAKSHKK